MKETTILRAINEIDDEIILRSEQEGEMVSKRRFYKRVLLAASITIIAALSLTTAFAYGEEIAEGIKRVFFGDSVVAEQLRIVEGSGNASYEFISDYSQRERSSPNELVKFLTIEEANEHMIFTIREPSYVGDMLEFDTANVVIFEDEPLSQFAWLDYSSPEPLCEIQGNYAYMTLQLYYAGDPNAHFNIQASRLIEEIVLGDVRAILISNHVMPQLIDIIWVKDDVGYLMMAVMPEATDSFKEMFIAIAESIG